MERRNTLVTTVGDFMWDKNRESLVTSYTVLKHIINYIENEEEIHKDRLLSVLRNITSNIQLLHAYFDARVDSS